MDLVALYRPKYVFLTVPRALTLILAPSLASDKLICETALETESFIGLIRPFVFGAHRYDACFTPWPQFEVPLRPPNGASSRPRLPARYRFESHTPYMATDQTLRNNGQPVRYFDQQAMMAAPLMTTAAIHCLFARVEVRMSGSRSTSSAVGSLLDVPRISGAGPGPRNLPMPVVQQETPLMRRQQEQVEHYPTLNNSKDYDVDFHRLAACLDPYVESFEGPRSFYPPGTLAGVWEGRFAVSDSVHLSSRPRSVH